MYVYQTSFLPFILFHFFDLCFYQEMRKIRTWLTTDFTHEDNNSLFLVLICRDDPKAEWILDKDGDNGWKLELFLEELSKVESLKGKPKIILIHVCQSGV